MKYALLGVEGPHDQAAVGRLLQIIGLKQFDGNPKELDSFWDKMIPTYPPKRLYGRFNMPSIYQSPCYSVAVYQGEGSNLAKNMRAILTNYESYYQDIAAFGLIVDADEQAPEEKTMSFAVAMRDFFPDFPSKPGHIAQSCPKTGVYVLPDNMHHGTLETLLVQCANVVYTDLKAQAESYLAQVDSHYKQDWRPYDPQKALIAAMVSILKPGATNTASIAQNNWIGTESLAHIGALALLQRFLWELLDVDESP